MFDPKLREYRYEERFDEYKVKCWQGSRETSFGGFLYARPEWLVRIVDVAIVSGHLVRLREPPPSAILWFVTDLDNNLRNFLELS